MAINKNDILKTAKGMSVTSNVTLQVIDRVSGRVVQQHESHNAATNSLLTGVAHHLVGDFSANEPSGLRPTYALLSNYVPRYISLGTMGLLNQEEDSEGLPAGIGDNMPDPHEHPEYQQMLDDLNQLKDTLDKAKTALENSSCKHAKEYNFTCEDCDMCTECETRLKDLKKAYQDALDAYNKKRDEILHFSEETRFTEYLQKYPGFGADGYDLNDNNNRKYPGIGYMYTSYDKTAQYFEGDIATYQGTAYKCTQNTAEQAGPFSLDFFEKLPDSEQPDPDHQSVNLELCSPTFPRAQITYRDIVPENESELPRTIDVVFSAMISTGALKQFRPEGKDYIYITEAGLWSKNNWSPTSNNGLLAGYRIIPSDDNKLDMSVEANRRELKKSILKVGKNQVVQVVWKIQIGSVNDIGARTIIKTIEKEIGLDTHWIVPTK